MFVSDIHKIIIISLFDITGPYILPSIRNLNLSDNCYEEFGTCENEINPAKFREITELLYKEFTKIDFVRAFLQNEDFIDFSISKINDTEFEIFFKDSDKKECYKLFLDFDVNSIFKRILKAYNKAVYNIN
jgi:hypothetical protein